MTKTKVKRKRKPLTPEQRKQKELLRRYKYAKVYNIYGRDDVARRARDWTFEKIKSQLGIDLKQPKIIKVPELKKVKKEISYKTVDGKKKRVEKVVDRRPKLYLNFLENTIKGYDVQTAFKNRARKTLPTNFEKTPRGYDDELFAEWKKGARVSDWSSWSSSKSYDRFPSYLEELAYRYNSEKGLKYNARYGFALVYYRYVQRWSETEALNYVIPDSSSNLDFRYKGVVKV